MAILWVRNWKGFLEVGGPRDVKIESTALFILSSAELSYEFPESPFFSASEFQPRLLKVK